MSSANGSNLRNWHYAPKRWGVHQDPYRQNRHHQNRIIGRTQSRISNPISYGDRAAINNKIERLSNTEWLRRKMSRAMHHFKNGLPNAEKP
jgi:MFS superfamily sulfate permease-like transporter